MTQNKGSGCGTVALVLGTVVLAVIVGLVMLTSFFYKTRKSESMAHRARAAAEQAKHGPVRAGQGGDEFVELRPDKLADYGSYQAGTPLGREVFIAWSLDPRRTTLGEEVFRSRAEGATVTWELRAEDISPDKEIIRGKFSIPTGFTADGNMVLNRTSIDIRCDFTQASRDSLLAVRRGDWVQVRGRLSFKDNQAVILDARLAGQGAEEE